MVSQEQYCAIAYRNLTNSSTGLGAMARNYPNARICSAPCTLIGRNLDVERGVGAVTVTVQSTDSRHKPAEWCARTRQQIAD